MKSLARTVAFLLTATAAGGAAAHTGHGTASLFQGLVHPLGLDHLLAMLAVGLWSALVLPAGRRLWGPVAFMVAMTLGAALGATGVHARFVEPGIALSVAMFGALLLVGRRLPVIAGIAAAAAAALLHGLAHGAELPPGAGFATYALGFLVTTGALHAAGLALGQRLVGVSPRVWRALAALLGLASLLLLVRA